MGDIVDSQTRSRMMSAIRSRNTAPEMLVRRFLHRNGLRFRVHVSDLPGHPDIVLPKYRTVVLVHGCFWHQHQDCPKAVIPRSNRVFWEEKLDTNRQRDTRNQKKLMDRGWTVHVVWECELSGERLKYLVESIKTSLGAPDAKRVGRVERR